MDFLFNWIQNLILNVAGQWEDDKPAPLKRVASPCAQVQFNISQSWPGINGENKMMCVLKITSSEITSSDQPELYIKEEDQWTLNCNIFAFIYIPYFHLIVWSEDSEIQWKQMIHCIYEFIISGYMIVNIRLSKISVKRDTTATVIT